MSRRRVSPERRPTIRDVSQLARVSRMTVSRFFSNPDLLLPQTRELVAQAARRLSYVPDRAAGILITKRSGFVALLLPTLTNSNFAAVAHGLTDTLRSAHYQVLIGYTNYSLSEEERQVEMMLARRPEAILLTGERHSRHCTKLLINAGVPIIELSDIPQNPIDYVVGFSNREAGRLAAAHLLACGYRRIGAIGAGVAGENIDYRGETRLQSFEDALRSAGKKTELIERFGEPPFSYAQGAAAAARLLDRTPDLDALFAVSDLAAVGAMMECQRRGIRIPDQLAVMGFGDFDIAAETVPPLTTISGNFLELGARAARQALDLMSPERRKKPERVIDLGLTLVPRSSTKAKTSRSIKPA